MELIELQQNRSLINSNFHGYKLSLDPIPSNKQEINILPLIAKPSDEQYSYLHAELFTLHNYLIQDHWHENDSYFINERGDIMKSSYDENTGRPHKNIYTMYKLNIVKNKIGNYPITFKFISDNYCILSNGGNEIELLETSDRSKNIEWKNIFTHKISEFENFVIKDSRFDIKENKKVIICLLQTIKSNENSNGYYSELIHCKIIWNDENSCWEFEMKNTLIAKGSLNYCAFECNGIFLVLSSNKDIKSKTVFEEEEKLKKENLEKEKENLEKQKENSSKESNKSKNYCWNQTENEITVKFIENDITEVNKNNIKIVSTKTKLTIWYSNKIVFDEEFFGKVDSDLTTWMWSNDFLELFLVKENECSTYWPYLFAGGPSETNENKQNDVNSFNFNQPIANLESQIEECDFPISDMEEHKIVRFNINTLEQTHYILLGKNPPLFSTNLQPSLSSAEKLNPPAIVIRQDVDACVWTIKEENNLNNWNFIHEGNLHAFGYVQASKQQKKFLNCSPNLQYAIICETQRHVFIYKLDCNNDTELRKRNGPVLSVGKQYVVVLENNPDIFGISITNKFAAILTEKNIVYLQIN